MGRHSRGCDCDSGYAFFFLHVAEVGPAIGGEHNRRKEPLSDQMIDHDGGTCF